MKVAIVGAGHAGVQVAASLREHGFAGGICLISDEPHIPYHRPPLSKTYLLSGGSAESLELRSEQFFEEQDISLVRGAPAVHVDVVSNQIDTADGTRLPFDHLVFATGARNRPLALAGAELEGIFGLRNLSDAERLTLALAQTGPVVVIGAGFIGMEVACSLTALGRDVTVLEAGARPLARAVTAPVSAYLAEALRESGAALRVDVQIAGFVGKQGKVTGVQLVDGSIVPASIVVVGVGVIPNVELALRAGLTIDNGIVVDEFMSTSQPGVSAVGDCANYPDIRCGHRIRLESVQNASDQARTVAARIMGDTRSYDAVPWFWSDQGPNKLQIVGLNIGCDQIVLRGCAQDRAFSCFGFHGGKLTFVESINRPADHLAGRRIISKGIPFTPEQASDFRCNLKEIR